MHILIIEDEKQLCQSIAEGLRMDGYEADTCFDGDEGLELCLVENYDLILLDLNLPGVDGLEILRQFRESDTSTPVLILSARGQIQDKVEGLDLGANDYITKPFGTDELLARVRATLRTARFQGAGTGIRQEFKLGDMKISYDARRVTIGEEEIRLTQTEYNIVELLAVHAGKVLTYAEIIKKVWGYSDSGSVKKLQVNMANIRKKFGETPGEYRYIRNELGVGYRMNDEQEV